SFVAGRQRSGVGRQNSGDTIRNSPCQLPLLLLRHLGSGLPRSKDASQRSFKLIGERVASKGAAGGLVLSKQVGIFAPRRLAQERGPVARGREQWLHLHQPVVASRDVGLRAAPGIVLR